MTNDNREALIAGALFDFAGHLTTMDEVYEVGASRDASRMVAELRAWAKKRGLNLSAADVVGWQDALATVRPTGGDRDPV